MFDIKHIKLKNKQHKINIKTNNNIYVQFFYNKSKLQPNKTNI